MRVSWLQAVVVPVGTPRCAELLVWMSGSRRHFDGSEREDLGCSGTDWGM